MKNKKQKIKHRTFEFEFELRTSVGGHGKSFSSL
jgi:hypothetical protein